MATNTNATPQKEEVPKNEGPETPPDSPAPQPAGCGRQEAHPLRQEARLRRP